MSGRAIAQRRLRPWLLALCLTGCPSESRERERAEIGRLVFAVDALRAAPNEQKAPHLAALRAEAPVTAQGKELRDLCVEAYSIEAGALDAIAAVRHAARADAGGDPVSALALLSRAEAELERSRGLMSRCADREGEARRRLAL